MKKFIIIFLFFLCLSFNTNIIPSMAASQNIKQGFHSLDDLNLSPDTKYIVQNNSFSERTFVIIFDSKPNILQAIRLVPKSKEYNLIPLQSGYRIVVIGGDVTIS